MARTVTDNPIEVKELAEKTLSMVLKINSTTREFYDFSNGTGLGPNPFWGWSSLGYLMLYELEYGLDPTKISEENIIH